MILMRYRLRRMMHTSTAKMECPTSASRTCPSTSILTRNIAAHSSSVYRSCQSSHQHVLSPEESTCITDIPDHRYRHSTKPRLNGVQIVDSRIIILYAPVIVYFFISLFGAHIRHFDTYLCTTHQSRFFPILDSSFFMIGRILLRMLPVVIR